MAAVELDQGLEESKQFFQSLNLGDIYGRRRTNPKRIPISADIYFRWNRMDPAECEEEKKDFAKRLDMEDIAGYGGGGDAGFTVDESLETRKLTWWLPSRIERFALLGLASALPSSRKLPRILEVGSGSGFLATLLGNSGRVNILGVDTGEESFHKRQIPHLPSCV